MCEYPDFEQIYHSQTSTGVYKVGHDSIRILKLMTCSGRFFKDINYFDLMVSVLSFLNKKKTNKLRFR